MLTPTRGVYAESAGLAARNALGATVDLERLGQVMQGWRPLRDDVTLGARGSYAWSSRYGTTLLSSGVPAFGFGTTGFGVVSPAAFAACSPAACV